MGRKPVYADNVARQQAYRDRVAASEREKERILAAQRAAQLQRRKSAVKAVGELLLRDLPGRLSARYCADHGVDPDTLVEVKELAQALSRGWVYREVWRD